jgi:hypothetical protein
MDTDDEDFVDPDAKRWHIQEMPLFKKGKEIFETVHQLTELIPKNDEMLQDIKGQMHLDAALLTVKIAGAEGGGLYDIRMEAAAIIRKAARDLWLQKHNLETFGFKEAYYFEIVRNLLEEYRLLFIEWVAGFDKWDYIIDRWGLFNPPGVTAFDKDPDEDVPFEHDL